MAKQKGFVPSLRGSSAIKVALRERQDLYVFNPQQGWIKGDWKTTVRAARMEPHAQWIYAL